MKHILIFASYGPSLINFRLSLIKKFLSKGYKVSVASPNYNFSINMQKELKELKVNCYFFSLSRTGLNIFKGQVTYKVVAESFGNELIKLR